MFKIIDRYFLKELLLPFMVAVFALVIIGLADVLFSLMEYVINRGISPNVVFKILLYKIPAIVVLFLPIASLFSVMLVMFRMINDNEIAIYWTSGVIYERVLAPFFVFALMIVLTSFVLSEYVSPVTNYKSNTLIHRLILKESIPTIEENVFFKDIDEKYVYVKKINKTNNQMQDIMIYDLSFSTPRVITAKSALWRDSHWQLKQGKMYNFEEDGFLSLEAGFDDLKIKVNYDLDNNYMKLKNPKEMSASQIKEKVILLKKAGLDPKGMLVEYYLKFSSSVANLVFAMLGIVFVMIFVKSSKDVWGIILSIASALFSISFFFFFSAYTRAMGLGGFFKPFWAAWTPVLCFLCLLLIFWAFRRRSY
jgi:LPS export ABC transporter permease LptG